MIGARDSGVVPSMPTGSNAELERLRRTWLNLGEDDPLWAVLSRADKRGGRWDTAEFLATGRAEIDAQLGFLAAHGLPQNRLRALDFGCGAGRLTRALAGAFEHVTGMDVSPSMLGAARRLNADIGNADFVENRSVTLEGIADASIDLVYSCITLQHIPSALALGYVAEFLRVMAPGGAAVFQFVSGPDRSWRGRVHAHVPNRWLNPLRRLVWRRRSVFEMHVLAEADVVALLARHADIHLLAANDDNVAGAGWLSRRWYLRRDAAVAAA